MFEPEKGKKINPHYNWGLKRIVKNRKSESDSFSASQILLSLGELRLSFRRIHKPDRPHEITVVIPRAEIRSSLSIGKYISYSKEMLLNSITLVDSPQRPSTSQSVYENAPNCQDSTDKDTKTTTNSASDWNIKHRIKHRIEVKLNYKN